MPVRVQLPDLDHWKAQVKCQAGCPVRTDAGRYVQLIAEGRDEEAFLVARAPNPFASVCGRVCAAPCEDACRRGSIDAPISIRALKRYVTERYGVESRRPDTQDRLLVPFDPGTAGPLLEGNVYRGHLPPSPVAGRGRGPRRKVAVIGAGPAGLSAAHDLALLGYEVTVFDASSEPGGMMRFGIPEYRLPRTLIHEEIQKIVSLGVTLRSGVALTPSFGLAELRAQGFESVFLSVGVSKGRDLQVPGIELDGVVKAVDYLLNVNRGYRMNLGRRVVVIGGGFVAFDAARTALRLGREEETHELAGETDARMKEAFDSARAAIRGGATEVTVVSLESFAEMPVLQTTQGHEEFEEARKEGIAFLPRRGPKQFLGEGRLHQIELRGVRSVFDDNGRFSPRYDDEDVLTLDADACVLAIGQRPDLSFLKPEDGVEITPGGTIKVDAPTLATSAKGIYAGGDVAFGPRNLIEAVANGKLAARSIHEHLAREHASLEVTLEVEKIPTRDYRMLAGFEVLDRETPPTLDIGRRTGIAEVETGYEPAAAVRQAARCLVCHVQTIYDPEKCVLCSRCVDVCPEYCLSIVPFESLDLPEAEKADLAARAEANALPLSAMLKDDDRCIRCGLCAVRCPTDAMTMEKFQILERIARAPEAPAGAGAAHEETV
jgi:NADPH-dependent glutamate synthase beta subunit-like oxidoreductase